MSVVQARSRRNEVSQPDPADADLLFKEAKQRERRRRLTWLAVAVVLVGLVAGTVLANSSAPKARPRHPTVTIPSISKSTRSSPVGSAVALKIAGPLAVSPSGSLYVVDEAQDEVLVRLADGQFRVVAGDRKVGFSGDKGPAAQAELSSVSAMSFAPNGDLYLADGTRVRDVESNGMIHTIAGNGRSGPSVPNGTPALSASLGRVVALTFSPSGELYFATSTQIFRLSSDNMLKTVPAIATLYGGEKVAANELASIAIDGQGQVIASAAFAGWSVYKIGPDGVATDLGYARRSGGQPAILQRRPDDAIEADSGAGLEQVVGNRLIPTSGVLASTSTSAPNDVPGITKFLFLNYFAYGPDGTLYADNMPTGGFDPYQQIVSVANGQGASLWTGAPGT